MNCLREPKRGLLTQGIDTRNKRRVIRLIENDGRLPTRQTLRPNTAILGLRPPREALQDRITQRVDTMLVAGLEAEVRELAGQYGWDAEPMKGVGYAQWQGYFEGTGKACRKVRQKIIKANLDLAKRQRTWFKRNKSIHWFDTPVNWQKL